MILLSSHLKNDPQHIFFLETEIVNQNSQLKKFEKKSVVSFCRRWTSLS